jgi:hypothetical protein
MPKYYWGRKWFEIKGGLPRLYLHEKHENLVRWVLRALTTLGVVSSVFTFEWYIALALSIALVAIDWFLERTLFYYSSMFVGEMLLDYDPNEWVGTVIVSIGEPKDPESRKIVGVWLRTEDYAKRFFDLLHNWTGTKDNTQGNLKLTFVVDEDRYYVFLYSDPMREAFKEFAASVEEENRLSKHGKEHFPLFMQQILCKSFETTKGFALGMFLDTNPPGKEFLLAPYIMSEKGTPAPSESAEPIRMMDYKFKLAGDLNQDDFEYFHWHKVVRRKALGADA